MKIKEILNIIEFVGNLCDTMLKRDLRMTMDFHGLEVVYLERRGCKRV